MTQTELEYSLCCLSEELLRREGRKAVILMDDFDWLMRNARKYHYEEDMRLFLMSFLNTTHAVMIMTGCYGGWGLPLTYSVLDHRYGEYFGFTEEETDACLSFYGMKNKKKEVLSWFGGYRIAEREMVKPFTSLDEICIGKEVHDFTICTPLAENMAYEEYHGSTEAFWTSLLYEGLLTVESNELEHGRIFYTLRIPNRKSRQLLAACDVYQKLTSA